MSIEPFGEYLIDSQLGIKTTGRNDAHSDTHRYPYEPTSYSVLDRLMESEYIAADDVILDYGCGMGRVPIYLNYKLGSKGYGVELIKDFYRQACENAAVMNIQECVQLSCGKAEKYEVPSDVTACFFFNPFDLGILRGVMKKIFSSYDLTPRNIKLFFYYPQDEYVAYLSMLPELDFVDEIDCTDLFKEDDSRNRIMVFELV